MARSGVEVEKLQFDIYKGYFDFFKVLNNLMDWEQYFRSICGVRLQLYNFELLEQYGIPLRPTQQEHERYKHWFHDKAFRKYQYGKWMIDLNRYIELCVQDKQW